MIINEKYELYPFHSFYEMVGYSKMLQEAYEAIETDRIEEMLIDISQILENYDTNLVDDLLINKDNNVKIHVENQGAYVQDARYNFITKEINLFINRECLECIKEFKNIPFIKNQIEMIFTHEDTHKQQDIAFNSKFAKDYIPFTVTDDKKENKKIVRKYFNQKIEIDAYARQFGCALKNLYPNETISQLFKRIFDKNVDNELFEYYLKNIYNQLTVKNQHQFLNTMYEYLRNEIGIPY